jgi:hypothetical protein
MLFFSPRQRDTRGAVRHEGLRQQWEKKKCGAGGRLGGVSHAIQQYPSWSACLRAAAQGDILSSQKCNVAPTNSQCFQSERERQQPCSSHLALQQLTETLALALPVAAVATAWREHAHVPTLPRRQWSSSAQRALVGQARRRPAAAPHMAVTADEVEAFRQRVRGTVILAPLTRGGNLP